MITLIFTKSALDRSLWKLNEKALNFCQARPAREPIHIVFEEGLHNSVIKFILVDFLTFLTCPLKIETEATEKQIDSYKGKQDTCLIGQTHIKNIVFGDND